LIWAYKRKSTPAHIRRLCTLGLSMEGIVPALMRALLREARCDAGVVLWFDEQGEISNIYTQGLPSPQTMKTWFSSQPFDDSGTQSQIASGLLGRRRQVIEICADDSADARAAGQKDPAPACPHRRLCGNLVPSAVPLRRLCCAVVKEGVPVAALMLYRPFTSTEFSREERAAVKAAGRYLSLNGVAEPVDAGAAMYRASGEEALLYCDPDGRIVRTSDNGYTLLAQASGCLINRRTIPDEIEQAGRRLIQRLFAGAGPASGGDSSSESRSITVINAWGLFYLRAFSDPIGPLGVLIERVDHLLVRLAEAMWRMDLSVQQGEALLLLAQGLNHERIAARMRVTSNTVDYHIRQLYSRLGVHTRDEAIDSVLAARQLRLAA